MKDYIEMQKLSIIELKLHRNAKKIIFDKDCNEMQS